MNGSTLNILLLICLVASCAHMPKPAAQFQEVPSNPTPRLISRTSAEAILPSKTNTVIVAITDPHPAAAWKIYMGKTPGTYSASITTTSRSNLLTLVRGRGERWYFAHTIINALGMESGYSPEIHYPGPNYLILSGQTNFETSTDLRSWSAATNKIKHLSSATETWFQVETGNRYFRGAGALTAVNSRPE